MTTPSPRDAPEQVAGGASPAGDGFVRPLSASDIAAGQAELGHIYQRPQPPPIRNATFAAALHTPVVIAYRGVEYVLPALSFPDGMRLYALARVFAESRQAADLTAPPGTEPNDARDDARVLYRTVAVELVGQLKRILTPRRLRDRWRVLRRGHGAAAMDARDVQRVLDALLGLPDEIERRLPAIKAGEALPPIDCLDDLGQFAEHLPAWVGKDGYPLSWRHFRLGSLTWPRALARRKLLEFQAVGMTNAEQHVQEQWIERMRFSAGMVH